MSRPEADILRDIADCHCALSPENLHCDGEISVSAARRKASSLNAQLRRLFRELGRDVDEVEAYRLTETLPQESYEDMLARRKASRPQRRTASADTSPATAKRLGLPEDVVGRSYRSRRTTFTVTGFKTANHKYPVLATNQNGKRFKLSVEQVLVGLGLTTKAASSLDTNAATARRLGLPEDIVGRTFLSRGTAFTVDGFKPNNHKFPVMGTNSRGTTYKWQVSQVLSGLTGATPAAPVTPIVRPTASQTNTATSLGLPADVVGRTVKVGRRTYKITGFKTANWKMPVLAERQPDGRRFKLTVAQVQLGLQAA
tara:strand:+ start:1175 stop:2113 length:939 start_codon:yes stop_codon:yes gene_type:complete